MTGSPRPRPGETATCNGEPDPAEWCAHFAGQCTTNLATDVYVANESGTLNPRDLLGFVCLSTRTMQ